MSSRGSKTHGKVIWPGFTEIAARHVVKVGRNDACPCGSRKKYKDCHEREGSAYLEKLALEDDRRRAAAKRAELKARGVPWYKRLLVR